MKPKLLHVILILLFSPKSLGIAPYSGTSTDFFADGLPSTCLDTSFAKDLGWSDHEADKEIVIEGGNWLSIRLTTLIPYILLRDIMGYRNVTILERDPEFYAAEDDNFIIRCGKGNFHFYMEAWESESPPVSLKEYVVDQRACVKVGSVGYDGKNGIYVDQKTVEATKNIGSIEHYKSIVANPSLLSSFPKMDPEPQGTCGKSFCTSVSSDGTKRRFLTTACKADPSNCVKFYHNFDTWASTIWESLLETLGLPFAFEYYGNEQVATVEKVVQGGNPVMLYYWSPTKFLASGNYSRISFQPYVRGCQSQKDNENIVPLECDAASDVLSKITWSGFREYDISAYNLVKKIDLQLSNLNEMFTLTNANESNLYDATCNWLRSNPAVWKKWIPAPLSSFDFEEQTKIAYLPGQMVNINVNRMGSGVGLATLTITDVSQTVAGIAVLASHGHRPANQNSAVEAYKFSINGVFVDKIQDAMKVQWKDGELGNITITAHFSDQVFKTKSDIGIHLTVTGLTTDNGEVGHKDSVSILLKHPGCKDVVPGKKGGFALFEHPRVLLEDSVAGFSVIILFLGIFIAEFVYHSVHVFVRGELIGRKNSIKTITSDKESRVQERKTSNQLGLRKHPSASHLRAKTFLLDKLHCKGCSFRPSEEEIQIHPVLVNMYPVLSCFTDYFQITAIILAPNLPWLNGSVSTEILALSSTSITWYFWIIVALTFPWTLYLIFLLTGIERRLGNSFWGKLFMFPSDYLVPIGATILLIPALGTFFQVFDCVPFSYDDDIIVLNDSCDVECWSTIHWLYACIGGSLLVVYYPLAMIAAPLWQSIQGDMLQVKYKPRFLLMDTLLKSILVFMRAYFRQIEYLFYILLIVALLIYMHLCYNHRICSVPWVTSFRMLLYVLLFIYTVIAILSIEFTTEDSFWPIIAMVVLTVVLAVCYIVWDSKAYPKKLIKRKDETRDRIRAFLDTYGMDANSTSDMASESSFGSRFQRGGSASSSKCSINSKDSYNSGVANLSGWKKIEAFVVELTAKSSLTKEESLFSLFLLSEKSLILQWIVDQNLIKASKQSSFIGEGTESKGRLEGIENAVATLGTIMQDFEDYHLLSKSRSGTCKCGEPFPEQFTPLQAFAEKIGEIEEKTKSKFVRKGSAWTMTIGKSSTKGSATSEEKHNLDTITLEQEDKESSVIATKPDRETDLCETDCNVIDVDNSGCGLHSNSE
eukprot:Nk52_evm79s352 gene=Nk52_evmTU79s352